MQLINFVLWSFFLFLCASCMFQCCFWSLCCSESSRPPLMHWYLPLGPMELVCAKTLSTFLSVQKKHTCHRLHFEWGRAGEEWQLVTQDGHAMLWIIQMLWWLLGMWQPQETNTFPLTASFRWICYINWCPPTPNKTIVLANCGSNLIMMTKAPKIEFGWWWFP